jgi:hypothetical protein
VCVGYRSLHVQVDIEGGFLEVVRNYQNLVLLGGGLWSTAVILRLIRAVNVEPPKRDRKPADPS